MKIVADRDIFRVKEYFSAHGDVVLLPGRKIDAAVVQDADALLVRTVTPVHDALLDNSRVRFVGSAASGTDHVDMASLAARDIRFSHAPGCNAEAVVDYVFSALAWTGQQLGRDWRGASVGIVGAGNVGGALAGRLEALGMDVVIHDPFLDAGHALAAKLAPLEAAFGQQIISLHTPLTNSGPHPTRHMVDAAVLEALPANVLLVNAARGEVIDNAALDAALGRRDDLAAVLDVWEGEPAINLALAARVALATPHIAGYSLNGKRNATAAVYADFCRCFSLAPIVQEAPAEKDWLAVEGEGREKGSGSFLDRVLLAAYPVQDDSLAAGVGKDVAATFDARRSTYRFRREYRDFRLRREAVPDSFVADLQALGFSLA